MRLLIFASAMTLSLAGCTLSESTCATMSSLMLVFNQFAAEGEFSAKTVKAVNAVYTPAAAACENPEGLTQAEIIALTTQAILALRLAMQESDRATVVLYPHVRNLERILGR